MAKFDGLGVLTALRAAGVEAPVLILSALSAVDERVRGLRAGGDDYMTKPFDFLELTARLDILLRRHTGPQRETTLRVGALELDLIERTARRGERRIDLRPREFLLLKYLMQRNDEVLTRAILLKEVWHYKFVPETNLVDVHLGRLRRKVDAPNEAAMIRNIRGTGFVLSANPLSLASPPSDQQPYGREVREPGAKRSDPRSRGNAMDHRKLRGAPEQRRRDQRRDRDARA